MEIKKTIKRNLSMDFFRGVMAILVAVGHYIYWSGGHGFSHSYILAVDFFLVLSGYVLTQSVIQSNSFCAIRFAKKRYLRLLPVYIFSAIVTVSIYTFINKTPLPNISDISKIISISQILPFNTRSAFTYPEPLGISWTISAELWFGIFIFPIINFLSKKAPEILFSMLLIIVVFSFMIINVKSPNYMDVHYAFYDDFILFGMVRIALDYSLGVYAFLLKDKFRIFENKTNNTIIQIAMIALYIFIFANTGYNRANEIYAPFIFMIFVMSLAQEKGIVYSTFSGKFSEFMGDISYPSYMIHPLIIILFSTLFKFQLNVFVIAGYTLTVIITSKIINSLIEKPAMRLLKG